MPVYYDSKAIIPAPIVNIQKQYTKSGDGQNIGVVYAITITGTLVAYKGSPNSSGTFWTTTGYPPDEQLGETLRLKSIIGKQGGLRQLFANEGKILEIVPLDGSTPLSCNPRVIDIQFAEGIWFDRCDYTITLETDAFRQAGILVGEDSFQVNGNDNYISAADESWTIEEDDTRVGVNQKGFRLTHTVSATGKRFYDGTGNLPKQPWQYAKEWVTAQLGFSEITLQSFTSDILTTPTDEYNHIINESIDEKAGTFSVTETWLLANDSAIEDFSISTRISLDSGYTTVGIEGTITGLESNVSKYTNATTKFSSVLALLFSRAQSYSGYTLNPDALTQVIGRNPVTGVITYSYEYDSRPTNFISGARSENISIVDTEQADVFSQIAVPGRLKGPILQDIGTRTAFFRTVNIELIMTPPTSTNWTTIMASKPDTSSLVQAIKDTLTSVFQIFVESDENSWDPKSGRYSRQIRWIVEFDV